MVAITQAELNLLHTRPHETTLWLSVYKPPTIFAAQINDAAAEPGITVIDYDNVTEGAYYDIWYGMTMYIGTTPGGRDIGRVRVRAADSNSIYVAVNSDIEWADDLYITVVNFYEINPMYPRMVADPADETIQTWYKDYDIAYTNQNSALGSLTCMGSHYAGFIDPNTGTCDVYYTASGTFTLIGADPNDYTCQWYFDGALTTGSSAHAPGLISYDTPGHYTTKLIVTSNPTGALDVSYRHISIYERPEVGTNVPVLNWELVSLDGSRELGGYQGRIKIRGDTEDIVDGALIVIFADDKYGDTVQSIGGNSQGRETIFFVGYILDGSISYNYADSTVEFTVGSPTEVMKLAEGFVVAVDSSSDPAGQDAVDDDYPSAWALLLDMDCKRALYHYLHWHSTVLRTTDFKFRGWDQYIEYFDADRESLFDAINNLMKGTLYGEIVSDRQGRIYAEVSVAATDEASTYFPTIMDVSKVDWIGSPTIEESFNKTVGYLEMGGIQFTPAPTGTFDGTSYAFLSCAPGTFPSYRGGVKTIQGLALYNQDYLNAKCGNVWAYENSKFAHVDLELSGNYRNIDIAPQEIITLNVAEEDTTRRIVWTQKAFHPTEMSWQYNPQEGILLPKLVVHEVTQGHDGTTIIIPDIPPTTDPGGGGYDVPPITIPPIVIPPFTGFLYVYHNGTLVGIVSALNFVDSA